MNLLIVNMTVDRVHGGGTAEKAVQLARRLAEAGDQVEILTTAPVTGESAGELAGVRVTALPLLNRRFWIPAPRIGDVRASVSRADVVVIGNHWTLLNLLAASAARTLRKPYVVLPSGALAVFGRSRLLKRVYNGAGGRRMIARANAFIATTRDEVSHFSEYGILPERVRVVPNAIDMNTRAEDTRLFRDRHSIEDQFILFVGRLSEIKGPDLLLEAFIRIESEFPRLLVVFAGTDEGLGARLRQRAAETGLTPRVRFVGFLQGNEKASAYAEAELVAIPSRQEAMSIVVLEAAAAGVPVLMTDRCGLNEMGDAGVAAISAAEPQALAGALRKMLAGDFDRKAAGSALQAYANAHFSWAVVLRQYRDIFESLRSGSVAK